MGGLRGRWREARQSWRQSVRRWRRLTRPARRPGLPTIWPDETQTWLLRACLLEGEAAREAWARWRGRADLMKLDDGSNRLLPLLYVNLRRNGVCDGAMERLKGTYRYEWVRNQMQARRTAAIVRQVRSAGVDPVLLKGAPLLLACYRDMGTRPMADLDFLVRQEEVETTVRALEANGWRPVGLDAQEAQKWVWAANYHHPDLGGADIHWHISQSVCAPTLLEEVQRRAETLDVAGVTVRIADPATLLFHVCVHGTAWNPVPALRWIVDSAMVLRAAHARIDAAWLARLASETRHILPVLKTLEFLRDRLGMEPPPQVMARLETLPLSLLERADFPISAARWNRYPRLVKWWCRHRRRIQQLGRSRVPQDFVRFSLRARSTDPEAFRQAWERGTLELLGFLGRHIRLRARRAARAARRFFRAGLMRPPAR